VALTDFRDHELRRAAARGAGRLRERQTVPALINNLKVVGARAESAKALGRIKDRLAVRPLISLLGEFRTQTGSGLDEDPHDEVGAAAAQALRDLKARSAIPALIELLRNDPSTTVRSNAAQTLGDLGGAAATRAIADVSRNDSSEVVRRHASMALSRARRRR
jgi:HEAT repeat protein